MTNEWRGKWALVTGASAGIGQALARELAAGGANLILTARRQDRLEQFAAELRSKFNVQCEVFAADLTLPDAPERIFAFTEERGLAVQLLVNNAGFGQFGETPGVETQRLLDMVQVNCGAVVHLTRLYLPKMLARKSGDILILSSVAAFQAVPYLSTYAATKAFDLLFAEGLAAEMRPYGIRVCALCPGATESEFHQVAKQDKLFSKKYQEPADKVARVGLAALAAGKSTVISGGANAFNVVAQRLVPRRIVTAMAAKLFKPPK
jgi:short-subunit dehydrogenase